MYTYIYIYIVVVVGAATRGVAEGERRSNLWLQLQWLQSAGYMNVTILSFGCLFNKSI